ncbi:MAG: hypothetical protein IT165_10905 [Bryobacterales bacterium]|nr:hypothetical protein [Bryobacterales bacterium]
MKKLVLVLSMACWTASAQSVGQPARSDYVTPVQLPYGAANKMRFLGNRITKAGQDRVILTADWTRPGTESSKTQTTTAVQIIYEVQGRLRFDEQSGDRRSFGYDGQTWDAKGNPDSVDQAIQESVLHDSAEQFFLGMSWGVPATFLGYHFRDDDGKTPNYKGPFHDIYEFADPVRALSNPRSIRIKDYYFNSETGYLDEVRYEVQTGASKMAIRTRFDQWTRFGEQTLPGVISRLEDGKEAFRLTVRQAAFQPKQNDGVFARPGGR